MIYHIWYIIYDISYMIYDISYIIYHIRHRAEGRIGVTSAVESFIHSLSSTSFQVQPPASVLRGSRLSLQVELQASSGDVS